MKCCKTAIELQMYPKNNEVFQKKCFFKQKVLLTCFEHFKYF